MPTENTNQKEIDDRLIAISQAKSTVTQTQQPVISNFWRADEAMTICASVLIFGLMVMILITIAVRSAKINANEILRLFGTVTIIIGALFLIVAGYTDTQMAPVMGLLGTVAGYILGKSTTPT